MNAKESKFGAFCIYHEIHSRNSLIEIRDVGLRSDGFPGVDLKAWGFLQCVSHTGWQSPVRAKANDHGVC